LQVEIGLSRVFCVVRSAVKSRKNHLGHKESIVMIEQDALLSALRTVKDPELNVNVVDLGLVYSIQTHDDHVDVEMTLTSPACPVGPEMLRSAVTALEKIEGVTKANVKLVMSPPWSPEKMSDAARDELGIF
jgi:metal-sulfur cluster biosynthetic enzyme